MCAFLELLSIDESAKRTIKLLNTAFISLMIISSVSEIDMSELMNVTARQHAVSAELNDMSDTTDRLKRMVIQQKTEEYILQKASELNVKIREVHVNAEWSSGEYWVPNSVVLYCDEDNSDKLRHIIISELGIGEERQEWHFDS